MSFSSTPGWAVKSNASRLDSVGRQANRAKGMEFAKVILVGIGKKSLPRAYLLDEVAEEDRSDVLQRERSLLYVAATRARDELVVMYSGEPSVLLP
jgi:superfamily I DNA/RNA helicase